MAETLPIPKALARRLNEQAERLGKTPRSIAVEAIEKALDYDAWLLKELDSADAEIGRGELVAGEVVKARAKAILNSARRTAKLARRDQGAAWRRHFFTSVLP